MIKVGPALFPVKGSGTGGEPVPCCEFCLGEYLAGIDQQWRTPATEFYNDPQQGCTFDLCRMHYVWYVAFMKEMQRQCTTTPS